MTNFLPKKEKKKQNYGKQLDGYDQTIDGLITKSGQVFGGVHPLGLAWFKHWHLINP